MPQGDGPGDGDAPVTTAGVLAIALPVVFSNATVPLQGAVDTAIMGNAGDTVLLAAVAMGAAAISLVLSSFNFLQIGISGTTAQAVGAANPARAIRTLIRGLVLALGIGLALILLASPILAFVRFLFEASDAVEDAAGTYVLLRLYGGPLELMGYALTGWFAGQGRTGVMFRQQIVLSLTNILVTVVLVFGLGLRIEGVAIGTVIGHGAALIYGLIAARGLIREMHGAGLPADAFQPARLFRGGEIVQLLALNRDIFVRSILLTFSFAWVARLGSMQGDVILAANGVLLQFFAVTSNGLDGFAIAAESLVGRAVGKRSPAALRRAVAMTLRAGVVFSFGLSALFLVTDRSIIALFTDVEAVREAAGRHAFWASLIPVVGIWAFMVDGIFVGAAEGRAMRNAMVVSAGLFLPLGWAMTVTLGNHGMWAAVWIFMIARALTLASAYPALSARVAASAPTAAATSA